MTDKLKKFKKLGKTFDKEYSAKQSDGKPKKNLNPYKKKKMRKPLRVFHDEEE